MNCLKYEHINIEKGNSRHIYWTEITIYSNNLEAKFHYDDETDSNYYTNDNLYKIGYSTYNAKVPNYLEENKEWFKYSFWYNDEKNKCFRELECINTIKYLIYLQNVLWNRLIEKKHRKHCNISTILCNKLPEDAANVIYQYLEGNNYINYKKRKRKLILSF